MKSQSVIQFVFGAVLAPAMLISCTNNPSETAVNVANQANKGGHESFLNLEATASVVDQNGQGVSGAQVLIGNAPGAFAGNVVTTNASGQFNLPAGWTTAQPVTITAPSFVQSTFFAVAPAARAFVLSEGDGTQSFEIKGQATGFGQLRTDGKVDVAVILPSMSRENFLRFDISQVMSPQTDKLDMGVAAFDLPSNVAIPKQTESYIVPLNLEKPVYRTYMRKSGNYRLVATHAQFPLRTVANAVRAGESIYNVLNSFDFLEAGLVDVNITQATSNHDIAVNQLKFTDSLATASGPIAADEVQVNLALVEKDGMLLPTDLKSLRANQARTMKTSLITGPSFVLSLLTKEIQRPAPMVGVDFDPTKFSFVIRASSETAAPTFLGFANPPVVAGKTITLVPPSTTSGVAPVVTQLIFSEVEKIKNPQGQVVNEQRTRLWEVSAPGWVTKVDLPTMPHTPVAGRLYRWEVMFLGAPNGSAATPLSNVTHVSRSQVDLP